MPEANAAPATGTLSVTQAASLLGPDLPPEQDDPAAQEALEAGEAQPAVEETGEEAEAAGEGAEGDEPGGDEGGEEAQGDEGDDPAAPAAEPIDPPLFWKPEDREAFAKLDPKDQARIRAYEDNRNRTVAVSVQQAAQARQQFEAQAAQVAQWLPHLAKTVEAAHVAFERPVPGLHDANGKPMPWGDVNWSAWYEQDPVSASAWEAKYRREQAQLEEARQQFAQAQRIADDTQFNATLQAEAGKLATLNPDLYADGAKRQEVGAYLKTLGYSDDQLKYVTAQDLNTAYKAMLWDKSRTGKSAPKPAQNASPKPGAKPPVRPTAASTPAAPRTRAVQEADNRLSQTHSVNDAVALLTARGAARAAR